MTESVPFLREIIADPDDDGPRLIYADWLVERGDPLGEFIHTQCERARLALDDSRQLHLKQREEELLKANRNKWAGISEGVLSHANKPVFRRGFVEKLTIETDSFLERSDELLARFPLREIAPAEARLSQLVRSPNLARLSGLDLRNLNLDDEDARALADSREATGLQMLNVQLTRLSDKATIALAESHSLRNLRSLNVSMNLFESSTVVDAIVSGTSSQQLQSLKMNYCLSKPGCLASLAKFDGLANLQELEIAGNTIEHVGVESLVRADWLKQLVMLDLGGNRLAHHGTLLFLHHTDTPSLRRLHLQCNLLGDKTARALASSPLLGQLSTLDLRHNQITRYGFESILRSQHRSERLRVLVQNNRLSVDEFNQLQKQFGNSVAQYWDAS